MLVQTHICDYIILTHWGRVTHICVGNLTTFASDNGLSPGRRQAIIWTNAGILLIGPLWTNFNEILIEIPPFSFKKMRLKVSSAKWWLFCLGLNELSLRLVYNTYCCSPMPPHTHRGTYNGWNGNRRLRTCQNLLICMWNWNFNYA